MVSTRRKNYNTIPKYKRTKSNSRNSTVDFTDYHSTYNLLNLPEELLRIIMNFFNYDTIATLRLVCLHFNELCSSILNIEFQRLRNQVNILYIVETKMPRQIPLTYTGQIIILLSEELQKLHCIFGKHIDNKCCCFFPGKILDEAYSLFDLAKTKKFSFERIEGIPKALIMMNKYFKLHNKLLQYLSQNNHFQITNQNLYHYSHS